MIQKAKGMLVHQRTMRIVAAQLFVGPHGVVNPERRAVRVAEVELGKVAREMGFGDVVEGADHVTLEDGEEAFHGI